MGQLFDIQGNPIQAAVRWTAQARLRTDKRDGKTGHCMTEAAYAVCPGLRKPVISPGKLVESGAIVHLEKGNSLMKHCA